MIGGCGPSQAEIRAFHGIQAYYAGDFRGAVERFRPLADKTDQNFVLNNCRLGSAALADYDLDSAESAFLRAYEVINSVGVNEGGRSLGAVLVDEKIKIWKGEPYERAMANFYLGLVYYIRRDYNNARASFENALFKLRDYGEGGEGSDKRDEYRRVESNLALACVMLGRCWHRLDTIRTVKSALGTGLIAAGAIDATANRRNSNPGTDLALVGAGLLLKATSQADVRQWEMLPRTAFLLPLKLSPGKHDITVRFASLPGLRQTWRDLPVPDAGEATYYFRVQTNNTGPFIWPPPALVGANEPQM